MEFENNEVMDSSFDEANTDVDDAVETGDVDTNEGTPEGEENVVDSQKQSPKQNKAFAEMRRKLEAAEKEAMKFRDLNARAANMFKEHGVKDLNEYLDKVENQLIEDKRAELKEAGYDDDAIQRILDRDKENMQLRKENETLKQQQYERSLTTAYEEVIAEYPDLIKSPDDIPVEAWERFEKGYSLLDAYESVNRKQLREREQAKVKQKTLNNINSKKHLKTEGDGAGDAADTMIDDDTLQNYLDMGFSKKEAIAKHKKLYG